MMLSLSIVIIAAVLASVALFFLLGSNVQDIKKQQILVIMGSLLLLAILISNFKSNDLFTFSLLNSSSKNKIHSVFSTALPAYSHKYSLDSKTLGDYLFEKNYAFDSGSKDYNEYIIYSAHKDEGASFFLYQLAQKLRGKGIPAFYVKMESPSANSKQFFRKTGFYSYQAFKSSIDYYLQQRTKPYIIIDNAQLLPRPVWDILASFNEPNSPHVILGSENADTLLQRLTEIDEPKRKMGGESQFLNKFQVQKFVGPDQTALQKLSPTNSFIKRAIINFKNIFHMKSGASEQEIILRNSNANNNVANYFGLSNYYGQIKRLLERGPVQFGKLRQANIPFQIIEQMEKFKLIAFRNGQIVLQ